MSEYIGFIGTGNMGKAMIKGLLTSGQFTEDHILVYDADPKAVAVLKESYKGIVVSENSRDLASRSDILFLAVKPQIYGNVVSGIKDSVSEKTLIVTIAAGVRLDTVESWFGKSVKIIRTMPNTPALCGAGMAAICPGHGVSEEEKSRVKNIFESFGRVVELKESLMDAFTALSGSSPAWVFMFIEALADGAVLNGIARADAYKIAAQAVFGSAKMVLDTGKHPAELKDTVCSPGGTTIEAVSLLEERAFRSAVIDAVTVCTEKAKVLSGD